LVAGAVPSPEEPGAAAAGAGIPSEGIGPHLCLVLQKKLKKNGG
jgi:hypothetical protein